MIAGDEADVAAEFEQRERDAALARMRAAPAEEPDEDENGRYCLDCGDVIPLARVEAVQAVRCIHCASLRERGTHQRRMKGGIRRYLQQGINAGEGEE